MRFLGYGIGKKSIEPVKAAISKNALGNLDYDPLVAALATIDWTALPQHGMLGVRRSTIDSDMQEKLSQCLKLGLVMYMGESNLKYMSETDNPEKVPLGTDAYYLVNPALVRELIGRKKELVAADRLTEMQDKIIENESFFKEYLALNGEFRNISDLAYVVYSHEHYPDRQDAPQRETIIKLANSGNPDIKSRLEYKFRLENDGAEKKKYVFHGKFATALSGVAHVQDLLEARKEGKARTGG